MSRILILLCLSFLCVCAEFVTKKTCKDVDASRCFVHNVVMDLCPQGPSFCVLKRNKHYTFTVDLTPNFSATRLNLTMSGDDSNTGVFDKVIKTLHKDACDILTCPVEGGTRRIFDVDFSLDKTLAVSKFPVKVKIWNENDESKACCFAFNVKIRK